MEYFIPIYVVWHNRLYGICRSDHGQKKSNLKGEVEGSILSKLIKAFEIFDKDGNGFITEDEIREVLGPSLSEISQEVWIDMIREID
jgi:hypothetical protein